MLHVFFSQLWCNLLGERTPSIKNISRKNIQHNKKTRDENVTDERFKELYVQFRNHLMNT